MTPTLFPSFAYTTGANDEAGPRTPHVRSLPATIIDKRVS